MRRLIVTLLSSVLATACSEEAEPITVMAQDAAVPREDAAVAPDAGLPDAAPLPDAGGARRLISTRLFGDMPLENRVHDPLFDLSAYGWFGIPLASMADRYPQLMVQQRGLSPMSLPVLTAPKAPLNPFGVGVVGSVKAHPRPLEATIWVGRAPDAADLPIEIALLGVSAAGLDVAFDFAPDSAPIEQDGLSWRRYRALTTEGTLGWLQLFASDHTPHAYHLTGPMVRPAPLERRLEPLRAARAQTDHERLVLAAFAAWSRQHLGPPRRALERRGFLPR